MSCFALSMGAASSSWPSPSPSWMRSRKYAWRRWCAGLAAAARSRLRRVRWAAGHRVRGRAPRPSVMRRGHHHRQSRSFAPVYVDDLYSQQQPMGLRLTFLHEDEQPSTSKPTTATTAGGATVRASAGAGGNNNKARAPVSASGVGMKMKGLMMMSPGRAGMGEVDLRAEMFIRKFREEMRLQSQRSAEEFQAMLARGT